MIEIRGTGHIYRNPKPHLRARHAWHPTLVVIDQNELIAAFDIGEAVESLDYRTYINHSHDGGETWDAPVPMFPDNLIQHPTRRTTHIGRPRRMSDGELVAFIARFYRDDTEQGIWNPDTTGVAEMDLMVARSTDDGSTWRQLQYISPPLVGQPFEVCHTLVELADGRWLAPVSCLRCWDGSAPNGLKVIGMVSADQGVTWPTYIDISSILSSRLYSWQMNACSLLAGHLMNAAVRPKRSATRSVTMARRFQPHRIRRA
ncbi:exo-alpha-sialidase [Candidatus Poribacteria bacterium]|nr:exo-alpha-sialidase [Candidatus Poribacteria bacterium]